MKNIWVILKREYLVRVTNKTFIIMTFLAPMLITLFYGGAAYFATKGAEDNSEKKIYISYTNPKLAEIEHKFDHFQLINEPNIPPGGTVVNDKIIKELEDEKVQGWLIISDNDLRTLDSTQLIVKNAFSLTQKEKINAHLKTQMTKILLQEKGISQKTIDSTQVQGGISMIESTADGEQKSNTEIKSAIGFIMAFMIYIFIFIYGSMVMRSAMEEKTNRIVEVIISSVKPFELMMGKILGVALVGLTQFIGWIILSISLLIGIKSFFGNAAVDQLPQTGMMQGTAQQTMAQNDLISGIFNLPYGQILTVFVIFFLGGYLLYSSLFAAIGSAVNQETDVQQFMMPVSLPLVFGFIIAQSVVFQAPNGQLAKIFSMIPFTSPIVMCVRIPFGVSWSEIALSATILFSTFILFVWLSGKIYRIGILMYGKKPSWKDFAKWIRQR